MNSKAFIQSYTSDSTANGTVLKDFFDSLEIPSLPDDLRADLDTSITQEEIIAAISSM